MENCVLTAPAQVDCMCDLPEGQLGASVFPDFFNVFPDCCQDSFFDGFWEHFGGILEPFGVCFDTFSDKRRL